MDTEADLQARAEAIVRRGLEIRRNIATAVAAALQRAHHAADGFVELLRAPITGAAKAVDAALPKDRESTLRQVVDGIGDGLATAAHAAELTLREGGGNAARFAREDLERLTDGLRTVSARFVDSIVEGVQRTGAQAVGEASAVKDHARATLQRIEPSFTTAIAAARQDPAGLAKETLAAGAAAARGAAGALFAAVGQKLQALGAALDRRTPPS